MLRRNLAVSASIVLVVFGSAGYAEENTAKAHLPVSDVDVPVIVAERNATAHLPINEDDVSAVSAKRSGSAHLPTEDADVEELTLESAVSGNIAKVQELRRSSNRSRDSSISLTESSNGNLRLAADLPPLNLSGIVNYRKEKLKGEERARQQITEISVTTAERVKALGQSHPKLPISYGDVLASKVDPSIASVSAAREKVRAGEKRDIPLPVQRPGDETVGQSAAERR